MEITVHSISDYPFDFSKDFAIIGDGPSGGQYQFTPGALEVVCVNKAIVRQSSCRTVCTVEMHRDYISKHIRNHLEGRAGVFNLVLIFNADIARHQLHGGNSLNMLVQYVTERIAPGRTIFLAGVDMTVEKDWGPEIERLEYCAFIAAQRKVKIVMMCENDRLYFFPKYV